MPQHIALPTGPGAASAWDLHGAASAWQAWADELHSTYVTTSGAPRRVLVTFENLPADAATVSRVTVLALVAGDAVGTMRPLTYLAGTVDLTADTVTPPPHTPGRLIPIDGGYDLIQASYDTAPGGLPWTVARRNALQAGIDAIIAADPGNPLHVDSVRLATDYQTATVETVSNRTTAMEAPETETALEAPDSETALDAPGSRTPLEAPAASTPVDVSGASFPLVAD